MSIFTCCEREDETKYFHPCACPSASFDCESEEVDPTLCGYSEWVGNGVVRSVPPLKYLRRDIYFTDYENKTNICCDGSSTLSALLTLSDEGRYVYEYSPSGSGCGRASLITSPSPCFRGSVNSTQCGSCDDDCVTSVQCISNYPVGTNSVESTTVKSVIESSTAMFPNDSDCSGVKGSIYNRRIQELTSEDLEEDAIARETPSSGTSCSSLWSTRDTGFSFTKRTSSYEIECANLINGLQYLVTPTIRRRTAVIGSDGEWEDVTVSGSTFTATSDTKSFDAVALSHIQGYEYQITGVTIEKT